VTIGKDHDRLVCRIESYLLDWGRVIDWRDAGNAGVPPKTELANGITAGLSPVMLDRYLDIDRLIAEGLTPGYRTILEWIWVRRSRGIVATTWQAIAELYAGQECESVLRGAARVIERRLDKWKVSAGGKLEALTIERRGIGELAMRHTNHTQTR